MHCERLLVGRVLFLPQLTILCSFAIHMLTLHADKHARIEKGRAMEIVHDGLGITFG